VIAVAIPITVAVTVVARVITAILIVAVVRIIAVAVSCGRDDTAAQQEGRERKNEVASHDCAPFVVDLPFDIDRGSEVRAFDRARRSM
jgi:hypothetical protein